ncbi:fructose-bisphosphate aldolase-lysine N-methyltransferase, chloroplastic-like [Pyrus communis]|uniref:fructose-bisphosphate aldolase-lysine N-methyltransferase, chloroplastic-like n=1 Tax=Pyrus communis TaxID=23211 RepID=UPI0035C0D81C
MLLGARKIRWRLRRQHLSLSYTPSIKLNFHSLSQPMVDESDDFLPWLERKAGAEISSALSIGKSAYGTSLFASKSITAGDCVLKVPYSVQLTPDNLVPELKDMLSDGVGDAAKLATVVLFEQRMGNDSGWAPYIRWLPRPEEMHCTIFWSDDELELIRQSSVYQETINQRSQIKKEFLAIRMALKNFPEMSKSITFMDFMHVYALVTSRAWGSMKGYSLIPFADFLNHDGTSESIVLSDNDKHISEVIADRNYAPGEQVLIRYGKFSNATLLLDFGFTLSYNVHDQVQVQVNIPHHDVLREMKWELLKRHHRPISNDVNGFDSSMDSFTIKEVRSGSGKGKGIPQSLRAFARVLCCASPQELNDLAKEAAEHDGRLARRPLTSSIREIEAHQMLLSKLTQLAEDCDASIKSLGHVSSPVTCERHSIRRQMAQDLLNGELHILKTASAWLRNYCDTLTTTDCHR